MAVGDIAVKKMKSISPDWYNRESAGDRRMTNIALTDPDRVLEKLGLTYDQVTAYQDILTDDNLTAVMGSRLAAVQKLEWDIVRDKASAQVARFVETYFKESDLCDIQHMINLIMMKNPYGMSPIDVRWSVIEMKGGIRMVPTSLEGLPNRWFGFNEDNELRFLSMKDRAKGEKVKPHRILLARNNPTYDNPYGDKLLSKSYFPVTFKRNAWRFEQVYVEKYAIPWVMAKTPPNWSETKTDELKDVLENCVQDGIIVFPDGTEIELMDGSKTGSNEVFTNLTNRMDAAVQKIWLGETLTTEITGDTGSYAAAKVHQGTKDERRDQDMHEIERVVNKLIRWMVDMNFGTEVAQPKFVMQLPFSVSKEQAERDAIVAEKLGVKFSKDYLMKTYNYEEDDIEIVEKEDETPGQDSPFSFAKSDQKAVDRMVQRFTEDETLQRQAEKLLNPIIDMIEKEDDFDVVQEKLLKQWPKMKTKEAEELIGMGLTLGEMIGRFAANEGE